MDHNYAYSEKRVSTLSDEADDEVGNCGTCHGKIELLIPNYPFVCEESSIVAFLTYIVPCR
jgi:hypothetical protein